MGSDAAIEAADVVLMDDDPLKIAKAIRISRKCLGIVYQNIFFAIGVKLVCLLLSGIVRPPLVWRSLHQWMSFEYMTMSTRRLPSSTTGWSYCRKKPFLIPHRLKPFFS